MQQLARKTPEPASGVTMTTTAEPVSNAITATVEPASGVTTTTNAEPVNATTTTTAEPTSGATATTTTTAEPVFSAANTNDRLDEEQASSPDRDDENAMDADEQPHPLVINLEDPFDKNLLAGSLAYTGLVYAQSSNKIFAMTEARTDGSQAYKHVLLIPPSEEVGNTWLQKLKMYPKFKAHFALIAKQRRNIFERIAYQLPTSTKIETKWQCIDPRAEISADVLALLPRDCAVGTLVITRATASRIAHSVIAAGRAASADRTASELSQSSASAHADKLLNVTNNSTTIARQEDRQSTTNLQSASTTEIQRPVDRVSPIEQLAITALGIFQTGSGERDGASSTTNKVTSAQTAVQHQQRPQELTRSSGSVYGAPNPPPFSSASLATLRVQSSQFPVSSAATQTASKTFTTKPWQSPTSAKTAISPMQMQQQPSTTTIAGASPLLRHPTSFTQASALSRPLAPSSSSTLAHTTVTSSSTALLNSSTTPDASKKMKKRQRPPESAEASTATAQTAATVAATTSHTAQVPSTAMPTTMHSQSTFSRVTQSLSPAALPNDDILAQLSMFTDDELPEETKKLIQVARNQEEQIKLAKQEMATAANTALRAYIEQQRTTLAAAQQKRARLETTLTSPTAKGSMPPPPPPGGSTP